MWLWLEPLVTGLVIHKFLHGRIQEQTLFPNIDMKPASLDFLPTGLILSAGAFKKQ